MSYHNKQKSLSPAQRIRDYFSLRIYGPPPSPRTPSPQPYIDSPTNQTSSPIRRRPAPPTRATTGFREVYKNGPRSDGEILLSIIKERRAKKKAKSTKIPRPKRTHGKAINNGLDLEGSARSPPLTPLRFADHTDDFYSRPDMLAKSARERRASKIPLPSRLVNPAVSVPEGYSLEPSPIATSPVHKLTAATNTSSNIKKHINKPTRIHTHHDIDADAEFNTVRTETPVHNRNIHARGSIHPQIVSSRSPIRDEYKTIRPRITRFGDFLRPKTPRSPKKQPPSPTGSTDSDESFQCIGIPPPLPPKEPPPVPAKDAQYKPAQQMRYKPPRLPLSVSIEKTKSARAEVPSPYHVPSNPFSEERHEDADYEMGYEKWLKTQQRPYASVTPASAGAFRLTDSSKGETLLPHSPSSSTRLSSSQTSISHTETSPPSSIYDSTSTSLLGQKSNDEIRKEALERRKELENVEKRAKARQKRSLVQQRGEMGVRRSSFYGFYETLLGKESALKDKRGKGNFI